MTTQATIRILKELREFHDHPDNNLYVHYYESNVTQFNALLIGPEDTPYEYGMFEFLLRFPKDYPSKPPYVEALTTNQGKTRFNPNIYAGGKVCLSILGTWRGLPGEEWRSSQGFQSVLISILSLMNSDPYRNEPGFEDYDKSPIDHPPTPPITTPASPSPPPPPVPGSSLIPSVTAFPPMSHRRLGSAAEAKAYIQKIRHETLRISVIQRLEDYLNLDENGSPKCVSTPEVDGTKTAPAEEAGDEDASEVTRIPSPFEPEIRMWVDLSKRLFLCYYDIYLEIIDRESKLVKEKQFFTMMPFEGGTNAMPGLFNYKSLDTRIRKIRAAIDAETEEWILEGKRAFEARDRVAENLQFQFSQCQQSISSGPNTLTVTFEMEKDNPFLWTLLFIGRSGTKFEGGIFSARMVFPPTFPQEQPRVRIVTPFFHANVSSDGVPYYRCARPESVISHIEALKHLFDKDMNPDPSCVLNRKCAELYWRGGEAGKKEYSRMVKRVVSRSVEYA